MLVYTTYMYFFILLRNLYEPNSNPSNIYNLLIKSDIRLILTFYINNYTFLA